VSFADDLFKADSAYQLQEGKLYELLGTVYSTFEEFTHDYYDESIEVYDCEPSAKAWDVLHAAGFKRIWQHPHPSPRGDCKCPSTRPQ
jgi:hypothetical protein